MNDEDKPDIPVEHSDILHNACGIGQYEPLPKGLEEKYWDLKRIHDRTGSGVPGHSLLMLVYLHGCGTATAQEKAPPTLVDLFRKKKIRPGDKLIATWRKKDHDVTLIGVNARTRDMILQFEDGEERELPHDQVRQHATELAGV